MGAVFGGFQTGFCGELLRVVAWIRHKYHLSAGMRLPIFIPKANSFG